MKSIAALSWPVPGGTVVLEIRTDEPIPAWAWRRFGLLALEVERFAKHVEGNTPGPVDDAPDDEADR